MNIHSSILFLCLFLVTSTGVCAIGNEVQPNQSALSASQKKHARRKAVRQKKREQALQNINVHVLTACEEIEKLEDDDQKLREYLALMSYLVNEDALTKNVRLSLFSFVELQVKQLVQKTAGDRAAVRALRCDTVEREGGFDLEFSGTIGLTEEQVNTLLKSLDAIRGDMTAVSSIPWGLLILAPVAATAIMGTVMYGFLFRRSRA